MGKFSKRSPEAEAYRKRYKSRRWQKRRAAHIAKEPYCRMCLARGFVNDGSYRADGKLEPNPRRRYVVADHIEPHKGDPDKFWFGALQTLCPDHHDRTKQAREARGYSAEVGADGWPVDPAHPHAKASRAAKQSVNE